MEASTGLPSFITHRSQKCLSDLCFQPIECDRVIDASGDKCMRQVDGLEQLRVQHPSVSVAKLGCQGDLGTEVPHEPLSQMRVASEWPCTLSPEP